MLRFLLVLLCVALLALPAGCGGKSESVETEDPKTTPMKSVKSAQPEVPKKKIPLADRRYGGKSHQEWSAAIKNIDPKSVQGRESVAGLTALIADDDVPPILRRRAAMVLGEVGRPAESSVPVLAGVLKKHNVDETRPDESSLEIALKTLMLLGPVAKGATPELVAVLKNRYRSVPVRKGALEALARIGKADSRAVQAVVDALSMRRNSGMSRRDWYALRGLAALGITMIGPVAARPAIIPLRRGSKNTGDEGFRRNCVAALGAIQSQDAIIPLTDAMTRDYSPAVRETAVAALAQLGPLAIPALRKLLKHDNKEVAANAAKALGMIGEKAEPAKDDLDFALDDDNGWLRIRAAEALWRITDDPNKAVFALVEELENRDRQIRMQAYRLFKEMGPKAKGGENAIKRLLEDKRSYVRIAAAKTLRAIQGD